MNLKKLLLSLVGVGLVAGFSFFIGKHQGDSKSAFDSAGSDSNPSLNLTDTPTSNVGLESEIARLNYELEQAKQFNSELKSQLESVGSINMVDCPPVANERKDELCCALLSEKFNYVLYEEAYKDIYSTDFAARKKSLRAMAQIGTTEAKTTLLKVVMNEQEDKLLRRDLIREMDWHDNVDQALVLLSSNDESVKAAIILAAQDSNFSEAEKVNFEKELMGAFRDTSDAFIQIAAIDYFANKNPTLVPQITLSSTDPAIYNTVSQHLNDLLSGLRPVTE